MCQTHQHKWKSLWRGGDGEDYKQESTKEQRSNVSAYEVKCVWESSTKPRDDLSIHIHIVEGCV